MANYCIMNNENDRLPACKYEIWLMGNKESSLPGLTMSHVDFSIRYVLTTVPVYADYSIRVYL